MSSYRDKAINPRTGKIEDAWFLDDYFGRHRYGIRFDGEDHVYPETGVKLPPRDSKERG